MPACACVPVHVHVSLAAEQKVTGLPEEVLLYFWEKPLFFLAAFSAHDSTPVRALGLWVVGKSDATQVKMSCPGLLCVLACQETMEDRETP